MFIASIADARQEAAGALHRIVEPLWRGAHRHVAALVLATLQIVAFPTSPAYAQPARGELDLFSADGQVLNLDAPRSATRRPLFGDLHIHTRYSFDAFAFGTLATPADAYRFAKGEAIQHPAGFSMQLRKPLDFYGVTDHAMFLGAVAAAADTNTAFAQLDIAQPFHNLNRADNLNADSAVDRGQRFSTFLPNAIQGIREGKIEREMIYGIVRDAWRDSVTAAQNHYEPGKFTTFVAYEYTSSTNERGNLHRNVVFRSSDRVPQIPFSRYHSQNPEGLWAWMDTLRAQGIDSIAIPHNSNGSNGAMFMLTDWAGNPIDQTYAAQRLRNEPLVEVTQVKGTSETHPLLSPNDEWADFEIMPYRIATMLHSEENGSYVRQAYLRGLQIGAATGTNPYQFGLIGSSDTHTGAGSFEEQNFFSKVGILDASAAQRGAVPVDPADYADPSNDQGLALRATKEVDGRLYLHNAFSTWGASGLAGVWAEENTRDAIFEAFRRRETFATSGPRLSARLFAGYDFAAALANQTDWVTAAYRDGVPMGAELRARGDDAPVLIAWAARDAMSAPLQRLQIIKGTFKDGELAERVYDVACSDGLQVDPNTHRCPDNGARVNLGDCSITQDVGAAELISVWQDPEFDAGQRAFYYLRGLENPTCRWSTWDAVKAGVAPRPDLHTTLQERVWTSPIWYIPATETADD